MGGTEHLEIFKVGQAVLAILMETQTLHQFASSVGGGLSKGIMASVDLDARHFNFSLYTTGVFQAAYPRAGAQRE